MGLRFNKRIKICKGVTLNVGKNGVSTSIGTRGAKATFGKDGIRKTIGIPGSGLSYTDYQRYDNKGKNNGRIESNKNQVTQQRLMYDLPEGFKLSTPRKIVVTEIISIILLLLGFKFVLLLPLALIGIAASLVMMLFSKQFKCNLNLQFARSNFINGNFEKSYKYWDKALRYDKNNQSAKILIEEIKRIMTIN